MKLTLISIVIANIYDRVVITTMAFQIVLLPVVCGDMDKDARSTAINAVVVVSVAVMENTLQSNHTKTMCASATEWDNIIRCLDRLTPRTHQATMMFDWLRDEIIRVQSVRHHQTRQDLTPSGAVSLERRNGGVSNESERDYRVYAVCRYRVYSILGAFYLDGSSCARARAHR